MTQLHIHARTNRDGVVSRRGFLAASAVATAMGWKGAVAEAADDLRRQGKACILLFLRGGPSQFETFDPKPGHANGGTTQAIDTNLAGVKIAEGWERTAQVMRDIALVRSMSNREGEHQRATYQMHTGYVPVGGVRFPSLGSIVASEIAPTDFDLPHFVSVGGRLTTLGSGFLGARVAPFVVQNPSQMPSNVELPGGTNQQRLDRRINLMQDLEAEFAASGGQARVSDHRALMEGAANLVRSPRLRAFDLSQESNATKNRYGQSQFGQGCLLARRLVETGVTFVEVESNGWDTHQDNFTRTKSLSQQVDPGFAALVQDLKERGRLDKTLVILMGEFGRTPRVNANTGRDHYPRAFSLALAGCGIKGGQVLGATSDGGNDVTRQPVGVADLFCTFCHALGINPRKENITSIGRPIKIVDGGNPVRELF